MTTEQIEKVLTLRKDGKTMQEIADTMGVTSPTISAVLAKFTDTRAQARAKLYAAADQAAESAVKAMLKGAEQGDGTVALELLDRLEVLANRKHQASGSGGPQVIVVVGSPSPTASHLSALPRFTDVEALPPLEPPDV